MKSVFFALIGFGLLGAGTDVLAQGEPVPVIVGGYSDASMSDKAVIKAAKFAVKAHAQEKKKPHKLKSIITVKTQVVAGLNYRFCLNVAEGKGFKHEHLIEAVVYRDLKGKLTLTSWAHTKTCQK